MRKTFGLAMVLAIAAVAATLVGAPTAMGDTMLSGVPCWQQGSLNTQALKNTGCAVSSLAMICNYYGSGKDLQTSVNAFIAYGISDSNGFLKIPREPLIAAVGGTAAYGERVGWANTDGIRAELDAGRPVEAWQDSPYEHHYVIVGYRGNTFYINDPLSSTPGIANPHNINGYFTYSGTHSGSNPLSPNAGKTIKHDAWYETYGANCGSGLSLASPGDSQIKFRMSPGYYLDGIQVARDFTEPVRDLAFDYNQNLNNAWISMAVYADGKCVWSSDHFGGWNQHVVLPNVNAKSFSFVMWTKQVGTLGSGDVANWYADFTDLSFTSPYAGTTQQRGAWNAAYSADCGNGMDEGASPSAPIHFAILTDNWTRGSISAYKEFPSPVSTFTFDYHQNWDNGVYALDVIADGKVVKTFETFGDHRERVTLTDLNASKIEFVLRAKLIGVVRSDQATNWLAEITPVELRTLVYSAGTGGSINGIANQTVDSGTSGTAVTAVANPGYHFVAWSDGLATATRTDTPALTDITATATFAANLSPAHVYTPIAPSVMRRGRAYTIYGYVAPAHTSGTYLVTLKFYKRNSSGVYVYHHSLSARRYYYSSTKTKYKATVALPIKGRWRLRAYHSDSRHSPSYSGYDYITVK